MSCYTDTVTISKSINNVRVHSKILIEIYLVHGGPKSNVL